MAIGDDIKTAVDAARDLLGHDFTLNDTTPLGACSYEEYSPARARTVLGEYFEDEIDLAWALIEVPMDTAVQEQDKITDDVTGWDWIIRRMMPSTGGSTQIAQRCMCVRKTL